MGFFTPELYKNSDDNQNGRNLPAKVLVVVIMRHRITRDCFLVFSNTFSTDIIP